MTLPGFLVVVVVVTVVIFVVVVTAESLPPSFFQHPVAVTQDLGESTKQNLSAASSRKMSSGDFVLRHLTS